MTAAVSVVAMAAGSAAMAAEQEETAVVGAKLFSHSQDRGRRKMWI